MSKTYRTIKKSAKVGTIPRAKAYKLAASASQKRRTASGHKQGTKK